jgi:hypothetical protein
MLLCFGSLEIRKRAILNWKRIQHMYATALNVVEVGIGEEAIALEENATYDLILTSKTKSYVSHLPSC